MPIKKISDLPNPKKCKHFDHEPPSQHLHLEPGIYEHVCPSCGKVTRFNVPHYPDMLENKEKIYDDENPDYIRGSLEEI